MHVCGCACVRVAVCVRARACEHAWMRCAGHIFVIRGALARSREQCARTHTTAYTHARMQAHANGKYGLCLRACVRACVRACMLACSALDILESVLAHQALAQPWCLASMHARTHAHMLGLFVAPNMTCGRDCREGPDHGR